MRLSSPVSRTALLATLASVVTVPVWAEPIAGIRIMSHADAVSTQWHGNGDIASSQSLCISSTSSGFRLLVRSTGLRSAHKADSQLEFNVDLMVDGAHLPTQTLSSARHIAEFSGQVSSSYECTRGPNAQLTVRLLQNQVASGIAGSYLDNLTLEVVPN